MIKRSCFALGILFFSFSSQATVTIDTVNEKKVWEEVNNYRHKHGWEELKLNAVMTREAEQHSREMAEHKIPFGHKKFNDRIHRILTTIEKPNGGAENVAYFKKNGAEVVRLWLTSSGHRHNIQGHYNLTGVGVVRDEKGWLYYTQIFARNDAKGNISRGN